VKVCYTKRNNNGPLPVQCSDPQYKEIVFSNFTIKCTRGENFCLVKSGEILNIENFCTSGEEVVAVGKFYSSPYSFYKKPCDSAFLNITKVNTNKKSSVKYIKLADIKCKCIAIPDPDIKNVLIVIPLVHSSEPQCSI